MFETAEVLHVPPWELGGFTYASAADSPICWRLWAWDFITSKAAAHADAVRRANS